MLPSGEAVQHGQGFVAVGGLAHHVPVEHHRGVGRDEYAVVANLVLRESGGLAPCQMLRHVGGGQGGGYVFVHVNAHALHGQPRFGQQLAAAWRLRCEQQLHFTSLPPLKRALYTSRPLSYHTHFPSFSPPANWPFSTGEPASL